MRDDIWGYFDRYKVFTEDPEKRKKILAWTGTQRHAYYFYPKSMGGGAHFDIMVPKKMKIRAERLLSELQSSV